MYVRSTSARSRDGIGQVRKKKSQRWHWASQEEEEPEMALGKSGRRRARDGKDCVSQEEPEPVARTNKTYRFQTLSISACCGVGLSGWAMEGIWKP